MRIARRVLFSMVVAGTLALAPLPSAAQSIATAQQASWYGWAGSWFGWIGNLLGLTGRAIEADMASFRQLVVEDVERLERLVDRAGFTLESVDIGLGLIPDITLTISYQRQISAEERAALLSHIEESGLVGAIETALVYTLLDIADMQQAKKDHALTLTDVEVAVDLIPKITITLERAE